MKVECFSQNSMIELGNNKLFVGGKNIIAIIDLNKCIIEQKIENETKGDHVSSSIYLKEGIILFGSRFGKINIYDIIKKTITKIKTTLIGDIRCFLKIDENQFITSSIDSVIRLWEYQEYNYKVTKFILIIRIPQKIISFLINFFKSIL